jgi:hypothetical protein
MQGSLTYAVQVVQKIQSYTYRVLGYKNGTLVLKSNPCDK